MHLAVSRNGRKRQLAFGRIEAVQSHGYNGSDLPQVPEDLNLFPNSDGFLLEYGKVGFLPGWDEESQTGQIWTGETIRDHYLRISEFRQALFMVEKGLSKEDFGGKKFWDALQLFATRDGIFVTEKDHIGRFLYREEFVKSISTKNNDREFPVPGLRLCQLVNVAEAKYILRPILTP